MKPKKLLVLSNMYPSKEALTFGIFVKNQVNALREQGLEVDVVAVQNPNMGKANVLKKYGKWALQTAGNLLTKGRSYDAVHAHYVFPTGMLALLYKKLFKCRMIITAHGGDIDKMAKKSPRIRKWTTKILREADHVIAVGNELYEEIHESFHVPKEKLSIINMGVNREVFKPTDQAVAREKLDLSQNEHIFLFVGNLIKQKGLMDLVQAYEKLPKDNKRLILMGATKDVRFREELEAYIKGHNVGNVDILEPRAQQEVALWMSAADAFVLPSHIEGFGLVALEAMSCHTPVVGTNVGGLRYLLNEDSGILVEPQNVSSLFEGMNKVLTDVSSREQLISNGEKRAQENDQQTLIRKVINVYSPLGG